jgi:hypothetical protein
VLVQHGLKAHLPPLRGFLSVDPQARQRGLLEPAMEDTPGLAGLLEPPGALRPQRVVPSAHGFDFLSDLQALFLPDDPGPREGR